MTFKSVIEIYTQKIKEYHRNYGLRSDTGPVLTMTTQAVCVPDVNIHLDYTEEEGVCEFCGNKSELRDFRGNCISCGGPRMKPRW